MHIHIRHSDNCLHSVEAIKLQKHKALSHISKLVSSDTKLYLNRIKKIHIENSKLNDQDYMALHNIFHECDQLNELNMYSNHIETSNCQALFGALSGRQLTTMCFIDNWIGAKIPENYFDAFKEQNEISSIDFSLNWLGDKGITIFLNSLTKNIKKLQLSCNDFYLEGLINIKTFILQCKNLSELDISYNRINTKSAEQIAHIINQNVSLKCLKINNNQIGDKGASLIADALKKTNSLKILDVSDNQLSCSGAKDLIESASKNSNITQLNLKHNSLNQEEINQILGKCPHTLEVLT